MSDQVLSIEQMQELKKLGIDISKASMFWHPAFYRINGILDYDRYEDIPRIKLENNYNLEYDIPTFTLQDILEMLPHTLEFKNIYGESHFEYIEFWGDGWNQMAIVDPAHPSSPRITTSNINPLRAAFEMIKFCKENGFI